VDRWLAEKSKITSTGTLAVLYHCLNRAINRAMARDQVKRNVVALCSVPKGRQGRPSKSLTLQQAGAVLAAAEGTSLHAYIVVSLLTGARTEKLRTLTWAHVDLDGNPDADPPMPPSIEVWRSVREGGDTKTRKSRRTLAMAQRCVEALREHRDRQDVTRREAGSRWHESGLVFTSGTGTELDAAKRPPSLPAGRAGGRAGPGEVVAAGATAQLRLLVVGRWCFDRGHRGSLWACGYVGDREGVPAPTAPGAPDRVEQPVRHGHGPTLARLTTEIVSA
jgi:integrase